jgi:hypothetical protein
VFLLERQISDIESYRKSYAMMVHMWQSILEPFIQNDEKLNKSMALNMQRVCYGFVSQTLLIEPEFLKWSQLQESILKINLKIQQLNYN